MWHVSHQTPFRPGSPNLCPQHPWHVLNDFCLSGSQLEVKEMCTFLHSQSNAEEKVMRWLVLMFPVASISTSVLKHEWRSEFTPKAKRTLAPSVFPSQLLTRWLLCGPGHLTGEVSGHTITVVAATIPALPFLQDWVGLHPPSRSPPQSEFAIQNETQEDRARQFRWGERDWNQEAD